MKVGELVTLLLAQDQEAEVISQDEQAFEISEVVRDDFYTGRRLPTYRPGVYNAECLSRVVIR